jgi:antirestriction protein ArdC
MMTEKAKAIFDELVNKITAENTLQFIEKKIFTSDIKIPCKRWSFFNQFIVFLSQTSDARGMRQWSKVGRKVIKGSHAIYIIAPIIMIKQKDDKKHRNKNKEDEQHEEDSEEDKKDFRKLIGFKAVPVFRVEDTEGKSLDYQEKIQRFDPSSLPLIEVAHKLGVKVEAALTPQGVYGFYNPEKKKIVIGTDEVQVFLHELSHAVDFILPGFKRDLIINEVVAEFSSAFLCYLYGIKADINNTIAYIQGFSGKARVIMDVMNSLERVEAIYNYIKGAVPEDGQQHIT